jgi:Flp pilus assembly protein TadB
VEFEPQQGERGVPWVGLAVVLGLLGLGIAYLWSQASEYRRTGSPRQRLAEAEQALKEGRITPQEFQERCESIMAEM